MKYMLDTNTCIFAMKQKGNVIANLMKYKPEDICISSITYAELVYGVEKSQAKDKNRLALALFLSDIQVIPYDDNAAQEYGYIRADLQQKRNTYWTYGYADCFTCKGTGYDHSYK